MDREVTILTIDEKYVQKLDFESKRQMTVSKSIKQVFFPRYQPKF